MTRAGKQCRGWAVQESRPALCGAHGGKEKRNRQGLYGEFFSEEDLAALRAAAEAAGLEDEIATARVMLRRLLAHLARLGELSTEEMATLAPIVLKSTQVIASLLREQKTMGGNEMQASILEAVAELTEEWSLTLGGRQ